jgi:hypothetical protein
MGNQFEIELQIRGTNDKNEHIALVSLASIGEKSELFDFLGFGKHEILKMKVGDSSIKAR